MQRENKMHMQNILYKYKYTLKSNKGQHVFSSQIMS